MKNRKYILSLLMAIVLIFTASCTINVDDVEETPIETTVEEDETTEETTIETDKEAVEPEEDAEEDVLASNNPTQERLEFLRDKALYYYWHGGDLKEAEKKFFQGITLKGDQNVVEAIYEEMITLDPHNTDYQRGLASSMILNDKLEEAVKVFENIVEKDPDNYDALMLYYVYGGLLNDNFSSEVEARLMELNPSKTEQYLEDFKLIEEIRSEKVNTEIKEYEDGHVFILLGYALDEEGQMQETLQKRLDMALKVLEKNPNSKIIVTGGVPKKDNTEAKLMREWLLDNGIDDDRIIPEGLATDTVENALFSLKHVEELDYDGQITVMSSASHIRRALTLFNVADRIVGNAIYSDYIEHEYDAIGEPDSEELIEASSDKERLVMYRDLLRLSGIWQYPGIQR